MNRNCAYLALAVALPIILLSVGTLAECQPFAYYETRWVGRSPSVNDFIVTSAQEDQNATPSALQGLFANYSVGVNPNSANSAAVMDAGYHTRIANSFYPTGQFAVAKASSIRVYCPVNWGPVPPPPPFLPTHLTRQDLPGPGPGSDNTVVLNSIATASGNPIDAMDIGCGMANPALGNGITQTSFLITAEQLNGQIWIVVYALTDPWGTIVTPYLVNGINTGIQGVCLGLVTSPGRVNTATGDYTLNEVVFLTQNTQFTNLVAHAVTFDIVTGAFTALDTSSSYSVPLVLSTAVGHLPAGIWIAQKDPMASPLVRSHHVGISLPNAANPTGAIGSLVILPGSVAGQPRIPAVVNTQAGGGPLSHVPWGHNPGGAMSGGPANALFGANGGGTGGTGPTGFYVVTPGVSWAGGIRHAIFAVDGLGAFAGGFVFPHWVYPVNALPNGTPLAHPALISFSGNGLLRKGIVWAPYSVGTTFSIDLIEGAPAWLTPTFSTVAHSVGSPIVPQGNFPNDPTLVALPKLPYTAWPGTNVILPDQKTNFKAEYGMFLSWY